MVSSFLSSFLFTLANLGDTNVMLRYIKDKHPAQAL
jgi:hypothetical protein